MFVQALVIMKNQLILTFAVLVLAVCITGCNGTPEEKAKQHGQEIWFEEYMHDYGQIEQDSDGTWTFLFKNLGKEPTVINRVRSTCGCTVPEWPREPIEPGGSGEITVKYNTALTGTFLKSVTVYSTAANSPVKLQIKGKVVPVQAEEE
jgi:hypothetical protein